MDDPQPSKANEVANEPTNDTGSREGGEMQIDTPISPVTLRFQDPELEHSFTDRLNASLHKYDKTCGIVLPLIPAAVAFRRCTDILPTSWCLALRLCRDPHLPPVPFSARPALHTALVGHVLVYAVFLMVVLTAPLAWLTRHRISLASTMRLWYYFVLPMMILCQPAPHGEQWTCAYVQGVHLHVAVLTAAIVPLFHQVPFAQHVCMSVFAIAAAIYACLAPNGIAAGLVGLVSGSMKEGGDAPHTQPSGGGVGGGGGGYVGGGVGGGVSVIGTGGACTKLMMCEGKIGALVAHVVSTFNQGLMAFGGNNSKEYVWNTHPNTATVAISLIAAHFFVTAAVSTLLYHREFGLRLAFLSEHHPPSYNAVLPPPPVVQHLWTARCALLWGMAAWQGVFVVWTVMHV